MIGDKTAIIRGENIMYEDALKLVRFISGGYGDDEYNDFLLLEYAHIASAVKLHAHLPSPEDIKSCVENIFILNNIVF